MGLSLITGLACSGAADESTADGSTDATTTGASDSTAGTVGPTGDPSGDPSGDPTGTASSGDSTGSSTNPTTDPTDATTDPTDATTSPSTTDDPSETSSTTDTVPDPPDGPPPGNPDGDCDVPAEAAPADVGNPKTVVGDGTPESCTGAAFVAAVAGGGVITFDCGPDPVVIPVTETAKIYNNTGPEIVIDGGGLVTLDGGGANRILYMNTCDEELVWTTPMCQNQDHPRLTIQNLTFIRGDASGEDPDGGGAIFVRGGRFKIINSRFFNNRCDDVGPDVGGAAVRVLSQYNGLPVYVVKSTFGGAPELGNICSNGGGLSSIGVSYTVINSLFSHNDAIGDGANPPQNNTPGGGSGGAIYNDGNTFTLTLCGTKIVDNHANEGGGAIFFVSNDLTGDLYITDSTLSNNPSDGFETQGLPGIFMLAADGNPHVTNSTIE
ncbi:MAG: hypothetical protein KC636_05955 [Myxococcales bacterium]|nr:hypothetical protein [Myxococcales bacterium]